ncbi:MAG: hypothetical protein V1841_01735 [Patescibacteria group bacterium]
MNKKFLKSLFLSVFSLVFLNLGFFYLKSSLLQEGKLLAPFIIFLVFLSLGLMFFLFLILGKPSLKMQIPLALLAFGSVIFWFGASIYVITAGALIFVFLLITQISIKRDAGNFLKINFSFLSKKGYGILLTGISILVAALLFVSPKILDGKINLPRPLFDTYWPQTEKIFASQYPGFSGDMTVDQFIMLQISGENVQEMLEQYFKTKSPEQSSAPLLPFQGEIEIEFYRELQGQLDELKEQVSPDIVIEGRRGLAEAFKINRELKGSEKMKNILYESVTKIVAQSVKSLGKFADVWLVVILFLIIKSIFALLVYLMVPLSFIIFKFLTAVKFFIIKTVKVDKEEIALE